MLSLCTHLDPLIVPYLDGLISFLIPVANASTSEMWVTTPRPLMGISWQVCTCPILRYTTATDKFGDPVSHWDTDQLHLIAADYGWRAEERLQKSCRLLPEPQQSKLPLVITWFVQAIRPTPGLNNTKLCCRMCVLQVAYHCVSAKGWLARQEEGSSLCPWYRVNWSDNVKEQERITGNVIYMR